MAINFNNSNMFGRSSNLFNDYSMLKTKGYRSLAKNYYASNSTSVDENVSIDKMASSIKKTGKDTLSETQKTNLQDLKKNGMELNSSLMELANSGDKSLFAKGDTKSIDKNIASFVESYNSTLSALSKSDNVQALQKGVYMTNATKSNTDMLNKIGITIGKDNRLSVDQSKLEASSVNDKQSLFNGFSSYGNKVANKAMQISYASNSSLIYNKSGTMNYVYSNIYSSLM